MSIGQLFFAWNKEIMGFPGEWISEKSQRMILEKLTKKKKKAFQGEETEWGWAKIHNISCSAMTLQSFFMYLNIDCEVEVAEMMLIVKQEKGIGEYWLTRCRACAPSGVLSKLEEI